jgi:hypothetical protein
MQTPIIAGTAFSCANKKDLAAEDANRRNTRTYNQLSHFPR